MKLYKFFKNHFKRTIRNERGSWWGIGALVVSVVGTGVSSYGSYQQGQAQKKMNQYNADVANRQAEIDKSTADQNIQAVQGQAAEESKVKARQSLIIKGEQAAAEGSMGIGGTTQEDITTSTFDTADLDQQAIKYNADSKAWAIKNGADFQAWDLGNQSNQYTMAGKNAASAGNIEASSSLLKGAGQTMMSGVNYKNTGRF